MVRKQKKESKKTYADSSGNDAGSNWQKLQNIYKQIPKFKCVPGCTDCCGIVPFIELEWSPIADKRTMDVEKTHTCPYAKSGKCDIYDQRPLMCRLFGASEDITLQCPKGCKPKKRLTVMRTKELLWEYRQLDKKITGPAYRFFRDLLPILRR